MKPGLWLRGGAVQLASTRSDFDERVDGSVAHCKDTVQYDGSSRMYTIRDTTIDHMR